MNDFISNLNSFRHQLRAENVIGDLINQGYNPDDIIVEFEGSHKKNWDYDILNCNSKGRKFIFTLSRNGLFSSLPEYLFLRPVEGSKNEKEEIIEFNIKQKRNANILFNPIENEIFNERVTIENHENALLYALETYDLTSLEEFWRIDPGINKIYTAKVIKILPFLHSIVGNFDLTAKCLEVFIEDPVDYSIIERQIPINIVGNNNSTGIGFCSCGSDMIIHGEFSDISLTLIFKIGPISANEMEKYLENGEKRKMIDNFYNYFVPIEYDLELVFISPDNNDGFSLNNSYLGYNT
jgi:hypothetical protein